MSLGTFHREIELAAFATKILDLADEELWGKHVGCDEDDIASALVAHVVADAAFAVGSTAGHEDDDALVVFRLSSTSSGPVWPAGTKRTTLSCQQVLIRVHGRFDVGEDVLVECAADKVVE